MIVRKAKIKDVKEISSLHYFLMKYHRKIDKYYSFKKNCKAIYSKYIRKLIRSKNALVVVAVVNKKIVGYMLGKIEKRPPVLKVGKFGHLNDAFVLKKYRNQGIGKRLTEEFMQWFKSKKIKIVELEVDVRNKIGLKAWGSLGFKPFMKKMKQILK